jgi:RHS repeat-associated protein
VKQGSTVITTNQYDGLNRRIVRNEPSGSGVRHYYYNEQWQVLVEADNSLTATAMYAYHPHYLDAVAFKLTSSTDYVYLQDANFNVTAVVDNSGGTSGNVAERYSYTPYGEIGYLDASFAALSTQASAIGNEIFFTGRERDPVTGLQLNRNRFYHATLGRWVNRDPIGYRGGTSNLYEFVRARPILIGDPLGLATPSRPDCCSGKNCKWDGYWNLNSTSTIFYGYVTSDFSLTGTDDTGCVYRAKGTGVNSGFQSLALGYLTFGFSVSGQSANCEWPIRKHGLIGGFAAGSGG